MYTKHASTAADFCWTTSIGKVKILFSVFAEETRRSAHRCTETELRTFKVTWFAVKWNDAEFDHVTIETLAI